MSSPRGKKDERLYRRIVLQDKCLALVLRKEKKEERYKIGEIKGLPSPNKNSQAKDFAYEGGFIVFQDFQRENQGCYWNQKHVDAITKVDYKGFLLPSTLLISGSDYCLEVIRSAWSRRVLRSPPGYVIKRLGDVSALDMTVLPQTQFTPLSEALCLVVGQLNGQRQHASLPSIKKYLLSHFPDMYVPSAELLHKALGNLIKERKLYHTGEGYFVVSPQTYKVRTTSPPPPERQILMTNDEAIEMLHGTNRSPLSPYCTRAIQTNLKDIAVGGDMYDRTITPSTTYHAESDQDLSIKPSRIERSLSLRILRGRDNKHDTSSSMLSRSNSCKISPDKVRSLLENINLKTNPVHKTVDKGEKVSVFARLFKRASLRRIRGRSKSPAGSRATFSAQFPPVEWSDPDFIHFHSQGTQTLSRDIKVRSRSASREKKHREKSQSLEARPRRNSSDEQPYKTSPRHYASRSSTLPRKPYISNTIYDSTVPEVDSANGSSPKSHSLPSSSINSPKISPQIKRNRENLHSHTSPARNKSMLEKKPVRLNNGLRITNRKEKDPAPAINNIIHGYRPTAFSSVRPEEKKTDQDIENLKPKSVRNTNQSSNKVLKSEIDRKSNLDHTSPSHMTSNYLNDRKLSNDEPLDFEVEFQSRTAQRILQGISDSVDTLADLNNCENDSSIAPGTKSFGTNAKSKGIWDWSATYLNNSKNIKNHNNSSESVLNSYEQRLCSSKSAYCMTRDNYAAVIPRKITSVSAGNTPLFETAA